MRPYTPLWKKAFGALVVWPLCVACTLVEIAGVVAEHVHNRLRVRYARWSRR